MRTFPHESSDMLTPEGLSILKGKDTNSLLRDGKNYFAIFDGVVDRRKAEDSVRILDTNLYEHLTVEQRKIPPESITGMKENYEERLNKTETTLAHITIIIPRMMTSKMVSLTST
jgi:hypothetical protein